jgi:hypothetical protein
MRILVYIVSVIFLTTGSYVKGQGVNPFEKPGSQKAKSPIVEPVVEKKQQPVPQNLNLEFRGVFFFDGEWHFSLFDRSINKGAWYKIGESLDGGNVKVVGFNEEEQKVELSGAFFISLKPASNRVLPLSGGQSNRRIPSPKGNIPKPNFPNK